MRDLFRNVTFVAPDLDDPHAANIDIMTQFCEWYTEHSENIFIHGIGATMGGLTVRFEAVGDVEVDDLLPEPRHTSAERAQGEPQPDAPDTEDTEDTEDDLPYAVMDSDGNVIERFASEDEALSAFESIPDAADVGPAPEEGDDE